jgi:hypothetical protein
LVFGVRHLPRWRPEVPAPQGRWCRLRAESRIDPGEACPMIKRERIDSCGNVPPHVGSSHLPSSIAD